MTDITDVKWHFFHIRKRRPIYIYILYDAQRKPRKKINGKYYTVKNFGNIDHKVVMNQDDFNKHEKELTCELQKNPEVLLKALRESYEYYEKNLQLWLKIFSIKDFSNYSNIELADTFEEYIETLVLYQAYLMLPLYVEDYINQFIVDKLKKYDKKDEIDADYSIIMDSVKPSEVIQEKMSLLQVALQYKKGKDIEKELNEHVKNFSWMANTLYDETYHSKEHYLKEIKEFSKRDVNRLIIKLEDQIKNKENLYDDLLDKFRHDKEFVTMIKTAQESIFFRSFRTERAYKSAYYMSNLLKEIAVRLGIKDYKDITYLSPVEIYDLLRNSEKADIESINERRKGFCMITGIEQFRCISGKELEELRKQIIIETGSKDKIIGKCAFKGKVKGKVCLVLDKSQLDKIKEKDILITPSTTVDYVKYLNKVSAIVTNEGGILCHASLISREMRIPTVIGTQNATTLLKDGDYVEVDADNGVVRKI
ncbi:PEP-utilizing enzyme [Nanoarchaeota archaeon]